MSLADAVNRKAIELGKLSVEMTTAAGSGHPSTALSLAHLVTVLMYHQMKYDPKDPWNPGSDRLVLSEGHAVPIIYAAMADLGVAIGKSKSDARPMTRADAMTLRAIDSPIAGHPNPGLGVHFFDAATGSLGQGLSVAAGLAAAARMDGLCDKRIYCSQMTSCEEAKYFLAHRPGVKMDGDNDGIPCERQFCGSWRQSDYGGRP